MSKTNPPVEKEVLKMVQTVIDICIDDCLIPISESNIHHLRHLVATAMVATLEISTQDDADEDVRDVFLKIALSLKKGLKGHLDNQRGNN